VAAAPFAYGAFRLAAGTTLHRIQRTRPLPTTVTVGPVRLPPAGSMLGRFDLPSSHCAAFALDELTAALETVARRNAFAISRTALAQRELLSVRTNAPLTLADLRPHTAGWPLLIADRYGPTQALSAHALASRYDGVVYLSAQQHLGECVALFGPAIQHVAGGAVPLISAVGGLHRAIMHALMGTLLPLVP
jgi:hypothetical protein